MEATIDPALAIEQKALRHLGPINDLAAHGDTPVQEFYDGATVFLTGGSGFLGKQLTEKVLRATNIRKLYLLLRPKKGKSVNERLQEILEDPVFELVRKQKPGFADKMTAVVGDVAAVRLGISEHDWDMLTKEVTIIFHVAATTRFDENLSVATLINVRGTRETLMLGHACSKLKSFVHVSTAYSNATDKTLVEEVQEKLYPAALPPDTLISLVENYDEDTLKEVEGAFIKGYPNMYTFAKAVAEAEVKKWSGKFPICIVRPAIVLSAYKEPAPGWTDMSSVYGASGLVLGIASGLMHVIFADDEVKFNMVPVDYVNNAIIVAGYETGKNDRTDKPKIYTVASANNMVSWVFLEQKMDRIRYETPPAFAVWYIFALITSNIPMFYLLSWIIHFIPAYIIDGLCVLFRRKPRLVNVARKMYNISRALSYFTTRTWTFSDSNTVKLYQSLTEKDKVLFNFDADDVDHNEYMALWVVGIRKYIFKDGLKNTEYALRKQFWFKVLHSFVCVGYFYGLYKMLKCMFYGLGFLFSVLF